MSTTTGLPPERCQFHLCKRVAVVRIVRAGLNVCAEHHKRNEAMFGCSLSTTPLAHKKAPPIKAGLLVRFG